MEFHFSSLVWPLLLAWLGLKVYLLVFNIFFHPLRNYPGPRWAGATEWWSTYIELIKKESWPDVLMTLHAQYGDVVRVRPNELHFAKPSAYHDLYNSRARWNKEPAIYQCFGVDHSSFGFLTYTEAKQRKDVLQPLFSRRAIFNLQSLIRQKIDHLVTVLAKNNKESRSSDLYFGFQSFTLDTIMTFCFAHSLNTMDAPDFAHPMIEAMSATGPGNILFKHFPLLAKFVFSLPPQLAIIALPVTAALSRVQISLAKQIKEVIANPETLKNQPHPIIYHQLLDPAAQKGHPVPSAKSLVHEAQTMMFAGSQTVSDTLMVGFFHILNQPSLQQRLRDEILQVWPQLSNPPTYEVLENLPLLTATIKESHRLTPAVASPLLRIVPATGATISGRSIPGGTVVGMSGLFVHRSPEIFPNPDIFDADRWLAEDAKSENLEQWLVPFGKGPRMCLGINLAWCELYLAFATMLRCFDLEIDGTTEEDLRWRDCFIPHYYGRHLRAWCRPVSD